MSFDKAWSVLKFDQPLSGNVHTGPREDEETQEGKPDEAKMKRQEARKKKKKEMDAKMRYGITGVKSRSLRNKYKANELAYLGDEFDFDDFENSEDVFDAVWDSIVKNEEKGKFRGYSRNTISGRAERQGKAKAWNLSRKVKRGRTRKKYARNKARGNVRPKMRRQMGAGGERKETKR